MGPDVDAEGTDGAALRGVGVPAQSLGQRGDVQAGDGGAARAEQQGRGVDHELVHEAGAQPRAEHAGPALDEHVLGTAAVGPGPGVGRERGQDGVRVVVEDLQHHRVGAQGGAVGHGPVTLDDGHGLVREFGADGVTGGEAGVVGQHGPRADDDGVDAGAHLVGVDAGVRAGDPLARAVGGRGVAVEGLSEVPGHPRTACVADLAPAGGEREGGRLAGGAGDVHPVRGEAGRAAAVVTGGVRDGVAQCADPRVQDGLRAGAGAAGVVAGLEGDVQRQAGGVEGGQGRIRGAGGPPAGQGVDLGVGGPPSAVVADGQDAAGLVGQDGPDEGVGAAHTAQRGADGEVHGVGGRGLGGAHRATSPSGPSGSSVSTAGLSRSVARSHTKKPIRVKAP
ncbi:hypothetical protein MILU53160_06905 [Micrococcus luteus]